LVSAGFNHAHLEGLHLIGSTAELAHSNNLCGSQEHLRRLHSFNGEWPAHANYSPHHFRLVNKLLLICVGTNAGVHLIHL